MRFEKSYLLFEFVVDPDVVAIEEGDESPRRISDRQIARGGGPAIRFGEDFDSRLETLQDSQGSVG